jgi:HAD superfamily hydrolase (TIGR01549 family)
MNEVFGKKPVTSRDFPVILFDAGGTLIHTNPPFEKFACAKIWEAEFRFSESELQAAITQAVRQVNDAAEADTQFQFHPRVWVHFFLKELRISNEAAEKLSKEILEQFSLVAKLVIPQSTMDLCSVLQERGYRLAIVTNTETALTEILRAQGMLGDFEAVITSQDAGAAKPNPKIFETALDDLDISAQQAIVVGDSYSNDILGAKRAHLHAVLYDPELRELKALSTEDVSGKVVSIESLRHNRRLQDVKVVTRVSELLEFFL